jgi:hypothetical protein
MSMIALAFALATPAFAQAAPAPAPAPVEAPDPARIVAARALIDVVMPPEARDGMIDAMLKPMMTNVQQAVLNNPMFGKEISADPKLRAVFDGFLARRTEATLAQLRAGLPGMFAAMERAYARRFTIQQMADAQAFFATPSGRAYMREGMTIMSDPDVMAWQRTLMQDSMGDMKGEIARLMTELEATEKSK